jgi:diguanylate cyclase (GGDEF)-like protein
MKIADRRSPPTQPHPLADAERCSGDDPLEQQIQRVSRIGKRLFEVADCVVRLNDDVLAFPVRTGAGSIEAQFCASLPLPKEITIVSDTRLDFIVNRHRAVVGQPHIRFYASHPIRSQDNALLGSVSLVDYQPRAFSDGDKQLLADLAALIERELQFKSVSAVQLELKKKNKSLRRKSLIDSLLGTWNRGAIMRILTIEAIRCDKAGLPLSLIVVDLDHFKKINDTYGHPAGDGVLVKVASRLRSCIRPEEALGRYGGEEFLVVLPGADNKTALAVAERMRSAVANQPEVLGGKPLNLTISAGVASTVMFPSASTEELISRADVALYAAKDAGRNRVAEATPGAASVSA